MTDHEVDTVMANIYPSSRYWCVASCGFRPGDNPELFAGFACACAGCIQGALSWEEFSAWQERESKREETPYISPFRPPETRRPLSLQERLEIFKARKHVHL